MTAYISRLLRRADRSAGIHPRPQSRYEPDPGTYFDPGPIEVDHEWQTGIGGTAGAPEEFDSAAPSTHGRAREPRTDYPPQVNRPVIADPPTAAPAAPAEDTAAGTPRPPNRQQNKHSRPHVPEHAASPVADPAAQLATPEPTAPPAAPAEVAASGTPRPPNRRQNKLSRPHVPEHAASPGADPADQLETPETTTTPETTGATIPPSRIADGARPRPRQPLPDDEPLREMDRHVGQTPLPATSFAAPRTDPPTGASRQRDVEQAAGPRYSPAAMPDPALRQRIVDAVIEPVRADPTEVVVHIDRIDVRAGASSQPPPAAPRHPRAAPMSLESYLRAQSRRRSG